MENIEDAVQDVVLERGIDKLTSYRKYYEYREQEHPKETGYSVYLESIDLCMDFLAQMMRQSQEGWAQKSEIDQTIEKVDIVIGSFKECYQDKLYFDFWDVLRVMLDLLVHQSNALKEKRRRK